MSKSAVAIVLLAIALLGTNAWWLYGSIDFGITHTYQMAECEERSKRLTQLEAIIPLVIRPGATPAEILAAARLNTAVDPYEKNGAVWVGSLGLKFDPSGQFVGVVDDPN